MSLLFTEDADLQLRHLESDPTMERSLRSVNAALRLLENNRGDDRCRTTRYTNGVWGMRVARTDLMILWRDVGDEVLVSYVGPAL